MDTSLVDCDVQPSYIRVTAKDKVRNTWYLEESDVLLPRQANGLGAPQTIITRPLPSPHVTGTITWYTQGVLVGAAYLPLANISQVTDFLLANFTVASSHAQSIQYSSIFLTDLQGRFFFHFSKLFLTIIF